MPQPANKRFITEATLDQNVETQLKNLSSKSRLELESIIETVSGIGGAWVTLTVYAVGTTWPARPTDRTDVVVQWIGSDDAHPPPGGITNDVWMRDSTV